MTITQDMITELRGALAQLPEKPRTSFTARDAVAALADEIRAAQDQGYALPDIADMLSARGVKLIPSTLGSYLRALAIEGEGSRGKRNRSRRIADA